MIDQKVLPFNFFTVSFTLFINWHLQGEAIKSKNFSDLIKAIKQRIALFTTNI